MITTFGLFEQATLSAMEDIESGKFTPESEGDIQAIIFHHAVLHTKPSASSFHIHAEPTVSRLRVRPDLVFGRNEVFVEIKLSKAKAGGYSKAIDEWKDDVRKLKSYKANWPNARCVFIAIDEGGYHSKSASKNYFDPSAHDLKGDWRRLSQSANLLVAEL